MEFIVTHNLTGILTGLCTFLIIGLFHPLVIKGEYYFGQRCIPVFIVLGVVCTVASVMVQNLFWSIMLGVVAFSSFWSVIEVREQRERVRKGWFPDNPRRHGSSI